MRVTVSTGLGPTDTVLAYFGMRTFQLANVTAPPVPMSGPRAGVDIHGGDLPNMPIELATADPMECWAKCNATKECAAWAYAVPGCDRWTRPPFQPRRCAKAPSPALKQTGLRGAVRLDTS